MKGEWLKELKGIIGIALASGIFLSLLTYQPTDLLPLYQPGVPTQTINNLLGYPGAYMANILFYALGWTAYALPVMLFIFSWLIFWNRPPSHMWLALFGAGGLLIALSTLLYYLFPEVPLNQGWVGRFISQLLIRYLNTGGTILALATLFLVSISALLPGKLRILIEKGLNYGKRITLNTKNKLIPPHKAKKKGHKVKESSVLSRGSETEEGKVSASNDIFLKATKNSDNQYQLPPLTLLDTPPPVDKKALNKDLGAKADLLVQRLQDFGVQGKVKQILKGPVITMYEFEPAPGIKVNKIMNLSDDLALCMKALSVRIVAPVPGKAVVGIEIPNDIRIPVYLKEIIDSPIFRKNRSKLTLGLGKDILGNPTVTDLAQIPHLLIAGATGSGKSVGLNCMICSLLFNATPEEIKLILIDPKMLELSIYEGIPHLILPVVIDPKKAAGALRGVVGEMERRYQLMAKYGVRHILQYNRLVDDYKEPRGPDYNQGEIPTEKLPYIVVVIDELADLMLVSSREVEDSIARLAQMARAAGIHLIVATQRPSVDVLTGVIKANFPARISYQVSSKTDSRTILDTMGAEQLLGKGDLLFLPPGTSRLQRIHGAYVSEAEIKGLVDYLKQQQPPIFNEYILRMETTTQEQPEEEHDEKYEEAIRLVAQTGQASISMIQRKLRVGYNRAARMIELMEKEGIIGPADGAKPREVYIRPDIDLV
jgi:S-DNA-T family DNA segregation ATPase FtsK/SpoIIIE